MAKIGNENAAGEVVEPATFRRPVIDAGAVPDDYLRRRIGAKRFRLVSGHVIAGRVGGRFLRVVQRLFHGRKDSARGRATALNMPPQTRQRHGVHQPYTIRPAIESAAIGIQPLPLAHGRSRMATSSEEYPCPSKSNGCGIVTAEPAASRLRGSLSKPAWKRATMRSSR